MRRQLVLYTRAHCPLCRDMLAAAQPVAERYGFGIESIDIDRDPALVRRYGLAIPVLELDGRELARHRVEPRALERALAGEAGT